MRGIDRLVTGAMALLVAGCGGAGAPDTGPRSGGGAKSAIPERLAGTWQATIASSRLADAPSELTDAQSVWKLKFLATGGEDGGPSLFLTNGQVGELVSSVALSGDGITLQDDAKCRRFVFLEPEPEKLQIRSTEPDRGCPNTLVSSVLQRPWRLVEGGPSRTEPVNAEATLASKEAFAACARRRPELGAVVDFRQGRAVPAPGQDLHRQIVARVAAPGAVAEVLADAGQYVGLRGGAGPDVDIVFHGHWGSPGAEETYTPLARLKQEAVTEGVLSWNHGDYSEVGGSQEWVIVRHDGPPGWDDDLGTARVPRALKPLVPCFTQAIAAANRLLPAPGPLAGVWRTDPVTVDDMSRTLREHGLGRWVERFAKRAPIGKTPQTLVLEVDLRDYDSPYDWQLFTEPRPDTRKALVDHRGQAGRLRSNGLRFETDGDRVVVSDEGGSNTYRWSIDGEYLTLTWQASTYPPYRGIPEEVFQRALFMTAKFKREG